MSATWVTDLQYVLTCDESDRILTGASILIEEGTITAIGPTEDLRRRAEERRATPVSARNRLAMPGLVNLHTHLPMTLLRGIAEGVDLDGFLRTVWAAEGAVMTEDTVEIAAALGAIEAIRGGTTTANDMYFHHEAAHRGAVAVGLRHVIGPVFFDGPGPDGLTWEERMTGLAEWPTRHQRIGGPATPLTVAPHSTYTATPEQLREVFDATRDWPTAEAAAGRTKPLLHTHVSETAAENADVLARFGGTPTEILAEAGALDGPLRVVAGHGVHLTAVDRKALAGADGSVAHCPGSNLKLASGLLHWQDWRADGIRLGIGTDGCSSSNDLDMWQAIRQTALLARLSSGRPDVAPAQEILRAATIEGARALGLGHLVGSLEVGKRADIILLDLDRPHLTPVHDVPALLVFAAGRADVTDVFVDGERVLANGQVQGTDEAALLSVCRTLAPAAAPVLPPGSSA
ncbi:MAG: amidohydrolase [Nostocoides sp.]